MFQSFKTIGLISLGFLSCINNSANASNLSSNEKNYADGLRKFDVVLAANFEDMIPTERAKMMRAHIHATKTLEKSGKSHDAIVEDASKFTAKDYLGVYEVASAFEKNHYEEEAKKEKNTEKQRKLKELSSHYEYFSDDLNKNKDIINDKIKKQTKKSDPVPPGVYAPTPLELSAIETMISWALDPVMCGTYNLAQTLDDFRKSKDAFDVSKITDKSNGTQKTLKAISLALAFPKGTDVKAFVSGMAGNSAFKDLLPTIKGDLGKAYDNLHPDIQTKINSSIILYTSAKDFKTHLNSATVQAVIAELAK